MKSEDFKIIPKSRQRDGTNSFSKYIGLRTRVNYVEAIEPQIFEG